MTTAAERRRKANRTYRCAECGTLIYRRVMWDGSDTAARVRAVGAIWIEQYRLPGRTWDDVEAEIESANRKPTARTRAAVSVLPLVRAWGGLPERRIANYPPRKGANPLFGSRPVSNEASR